MFRQKSFKLYILCNYVYSKVLTTNKYWQLLTLVCFQDNVFLFFFLFLKNLAHLLFSVFNFVLLLYFPVKYHVNCMLVSRVIRFLSIRNIHYQTNILNKITENPEDMLNCNRLAFILRKPNENYI